MRKRRAFVGPLGDDIPSIFPIIAGILLFIGTVAYAVNLVNEKNSYLEIRKASLGLSYIITEKGVVTEKAFAPKCQVMNQYATSSAVKFLVTIKRFCNGIVLTEDPTAPASPYYIQNLSDSDYTWLYCSNQQLSGTYLDPPKNAVLLDYPVAVPCPGVKSATNGLGLINVIVWR